MNHRYKIALLVVLFSIGQISFAMGQKIKSSEDTRGEVKILRQDNSIASLKDTENLKKDVKNGKELVFTDIDGRIRKKVPIINRDHVVQGRKIKESTSILPSKNLNSIVVNNLQKDLDERDTYKILSTRTSTYSWYDSTGNLICSNDMPGRTSVSKISDDGSVIIVFKSGYDMVEFEKYQGGEEDTTVTDHKIWAIDQTCKEIYSRSVNYYALSDLKISPLGRWITYTGEADSSDDGNWKRNIVAIELRTGKKYETTTPEFPERIEDDGTVHFEEKIWRPGFTTSFEDLGKR